MADLEQRRYPEPKQRELSDEEKARLRARIERGEGDIYRLAQEFGCSSSQVAGIKAAMLSPLRHAISAATCYLRRDMLSPRKWEVIRS